MGLKRAIRILGMLPRIFFGVFDGSRALGRIYSIFILIGIGFHPASPFSVVFIIIVLLFHEIILVCNTVSSLSTWGQAAFLLSKNTLDPFPERGRFLAWQNNGK
jgi:hypothetical protein